MEKKNKKTTHTHVFDHQNIQSRNIALRALGETQTGNLWLM